MQYVDLAPGPGLAGRVRYWRLTGEDGAASEREPEPALEPVPPDGCVELIVHLGEPFLAREGERRVLQPRALLAGPGTRPVELAPSGRVDVIGVRLEPGVAADLVGLPPLEELVDRLPELASVAGELARGLAAELAEPARGEAWTDVLDRRLARALRADGCGPARSNGRSNGRAGGPSVERAVARLRATHGKIPLDALAREMGLSARQLERRFRARVGFGPKLLARIARFQHAWRLASGAPQSTLAALAARAGYYDQAHLVRDFRQFAGEVPSRFLRAERELTPLFRG